MTAIARILIQPYDERWPAEFACLRGRLAAGLGDLAVNIDHIGSTSVPGLAAKDIIDVQISVADLDDPRLVPCFQRLGAAPTDIVTDHVPPGDRGDPLDWQKRYFRAPASWRRTHIHVRAIGRSKVKDPVCDLVMNAAERWAAEVSWAP